MKKQLMLYIFTFLVIGCNKTNQLSDHQIERATPQASNEQNQTEENITPLSNINLSKIGHIAPKGRVQDEDYNQLKLVEDLISNGKESIPFLINKLDDKTKIDDQVMDYWGEIRVGDVAFIILTNFFETTDWQHSTISGVGWNEFLGCTNSNVPAYNCYSDYVKKNGRKKIKARWQKIWEENRDKIYWDETDKCFKMKSV